MTDAFDLTDRVAIVTGGSRGLGREMALAFARRGADVVIASRKLDACEELAREVRDETGRAALAAACHVGDWDDCDALVEASYDRFDTIDILVNNAGMSPPYESVVDVSMELWDKVVNVNLRGPFRLSSLVGTRMAAHGRGSIINISTVGASTGSATDVPYASAKAGLNNMTLSMARAFAPDVRVNCIMPGSFMTDISTHWLQPMLDALETRVPLGRGGNPSEIVGAALYFASDASSYTTGSLLKVDGGIASA